MEKFCLFQSRPLQSEAVLGCLGNPLAAQGAGSHPALLFGVAGPGACTSPRTQRLVECVRLLFQIRKTKSTWWKEPQTKVYSC